ncbi:MAG: TonB-dependent receptor [Spirosomaceae bacterium]|nr:TonB-dependent receptor [Spirosomataceae bacterium]
MKTILLYIVIISGLNLTAFAQNGTLKIQVTSQAENVEFASVSLKNTAFGGLTNENGEITFSKIPFGSYELSVTMIGYKKYSGIIKLTAQNASQTLVITLLEDNLQLAEVVVSGTMKEVSKLDSPVPVEVYTSKFFRANPTPSIFESLQNVNGVRPQLNCNVCNTGDIHINGLEGPYTMILIDGMPIVSGLSTVYGLTGIPQALIERVEVVKGPASTLYGSEAVGGLVNIITKSPDKAPKFSADIFSTTWADVNADIGVKFNAGKKASSLLGINYFKYQNPIDNNGDGFTDITLQNRISVFNKWSFDRKDNRVFNIAARYIYEDRWGGEMRWSPEFRGGEDVYGESIFTSRWETFGVYQLPTNEDLKFQFSTNGHKQNSVYGSTVYNADQYIGFGQLLWSKKLNTKHDFLSGAALRYTYYDDNTPATGAADGVNAPSKIFLPGIFMQDEWTINSQNKLLMSARYDYNSVHGSILSPRLNYKWNSTDRMNILRLSVGNGYRVANVFTEDHAALTGARQVLFEEELNPETSWNTNLNFVKQIFTDNNTFITLDATAFYTYFSNKIIPDYLTDPNKIIYANLDGFAVSRGFSMNLNASFTNSLKMNIGGTFQDVFNEENGERQVQLLTERFSGVWSVGYTIPSWNVSVDYTGNIYAPMRLPTLGELDPRPEFSPWWSVQNIQLTKPLRNGWKIYGGVKNLLNFTPPANSIARSFDPFDKNVEFNADGQAIPTADNPYALTFDPTYVFAPNQGRRAFFGVRVSLK